MLGPRISRRLRLLGNADRKGPISLLPGKPWSLREILVDPLRGARFQQLVNQARYVTMRHENQPSLTGLVFLAHWTQHWFGAGPSFSSCSLYAPNRTGLLSGRPCGTLRYKQLSQLGGGRGMHIVPNGCGCDPDMTQPSRKAWKM